MTQQPNLQSIDGQSMNLTDHNLEQLKQLFPNVFTEGKIDFDALKSELGAHVEKENERYQFTWNGKEQAKRMATTPTLGTLRPAPEESVNWETTENLYIEGDNLEVLKLLQKSYFGKVKMIYIDPPYNTGKDFVYKDDFKDNLANYQRLTGQKDDEGNPLTTNSDSSGRYHSNWLNMMYPRLKLARNLLKDDGVIFISIDDNEVHNLRKICDEIFGEGNFVAELLWKRRASSAMADNNVSSDHEYVICYQKGLLKGFSGIEKDFKSYSNPDEDPRGDWVTGDLTVGMTASMRPNQAYDLIDPETGISYPHNPNRVWAYIPESMNKLIQEGRVIFPKDVEKRPMLKRFKNELKSTFNPFSS
ncbi:Type III restriction-modification system methylation subunit, partial [hydrothermal vent metagenome]